MASTSEALTRALALVVARPWPWSVLLIAVLGGCGARERRDPMLLGVSPDRVSRALDALVALEGERFLPRARVVLDRDRAPTLDHDFEVQVGGVSLPPDDVRWVDEGHIDVRIAAGHPAGRHEVRVIAPDGRSSALANALEVSDEPYGLHVSIEDQPGGGGAPVGARTLAAGSELVLHAVLRGEGGEFAGGVAASWQSELDLGEIAAGPAASSTFLAERVGETVVSARHAVAGDGTTGTLAITAGPAVSVSLESAPGGDGEAVLPGTLTSDDTLRLFAVERDAFGNFVRDASGRFHFEGSLSELPATEGSSVERDLSRTGPGQVRFEHPELGSVSLALEVEPGRVVELEIAPDVVSLDADDPALPFEVVAARDGDGNDTADLGQLTWSIAEGSISDLDSVSGVLDPVVAGRGRVRVDSSHGVFDETGTIEIAPGQVAELAVALPVATLSADDAPVTLSVVARDADGNPTDQVGSLSWSVSSGGISSVDPVSGVLDPREAGTGTVRVQSSLGPAGDSPPLTITPGRAVSLGVFPSSLALSADDAPVDFVASGVDADGNVTGDLGTLSWSVASGPIGSLDSATGRFDPTTVGTGAVRVQSSHGPIGSDVPVVITAGRAAALSIAPASLTLSADAAPVDFVASGVDADGNATSDLGTLSWSVSSGPIGSLNAGSGQLDPTTAGTGRVRATSSHGATAETGDVVVTPGAAAALELLPVTLTLSADAAPVDFVASGVDADGNATSDLGTLSWSVSSGPIGSLNGTGQLDPTTAGTGRVRATSSHGASVESGDVVVTPGRAALLVVAPDAATTYLDGGPSLAFSVTARDADGNDTADVGVVSWSVSSGALSSLDAQTGVLTPLAEGSGRVRATSSHGPFDDSGDVQIAGAVALLDVDPFGDGSSFAQVASFDGQIYLGPSADGAALARSNGDGSPWENVSPSFEDMSKLDNSASPPFASIGFTGCVEDTLECGPDNEDGRGEMGAGTLAGSEWLALGGARSGGNLDFVYLAPAGASPLEFRAVDVSDALGGETKGTTAVHFFRDRLYLGFADTGGSRPYLAALITPPPAGGLDAQKGTDVLDLDGQEMPGLKTNSQAMIDVIGDFADRLYLANAGGWMRSTVEQPGSYHDFPGDWTSTLPTAVEYSAFASLTTSKTADLTPRDRAVPAMAAFGGWFYAARNTTLGPQLWGCDPLASSGPDCDPDDWRLCAPNASGNPGLSQFGNPDNAFLTLIAASDSALYVGFDNAVDGVVTFRTTVAGACSPADFQGDAGCSAASHPGACDGLGGSGLGDGMTRFFSARAAPFGSGSAVFVTAADGAGPVHAYRFLP